MGGGEGEGVLAQLAVFVLGVRRVAEEATVEQRAVQVRNERAGLAQRARLAQSCHVVSHLWGEAGMP